MIVPNNAQVEVAQKAVNASRIKVRTKRDTFSVTGARNVENRVKAYTSNLGLDILSASP